MFNQQRNSVIEKLKYGHPYSRSGTIRGDLNMRKSMKYVQSTNEFRENYNVRSQVLKNQAKKSIKS